MKRLITIALCLFITGAFAQPYAIGHSSVTFVDSARSNRQVPVEVYYPAAAAGNDVPVLAGQFPLISFGHGFVMDWTAYDNIWQAVVPQGYIMVFPTTESGFAPVHADFAADLYFVIKKMQRLSSLDASSLFFGHAATTSAIMGHSMGGGCSFLAVSGDTTITTMVTLAAANTTPSSITAAGATTIPSLVIAGANDCVAPPVSNQLPMYDSLASSCKAYFEIIGGGHCFFANNNFNCSFGEGTCMPTPTITRAEQQDAAQDVMLLWLDHFLKNDQQSWQSLEDTAAISQRYTASVSCALPASIKYMNEPQGLRIYPNPTTGIVVLNLQDLPQDYKALDVYDISGSLQQVEVKERLANEELLIDLSGLVPGIYYCRLQTGKQVVWTKLTKL